MRLDTDFVAESGLGLRYVFVGLLEAAAVAIEQPAVIIAAQAALLDESVRHVRAAMRAMAIHQSEGAGHVLVESEILAHQTHGFDGLRVEFAESGDGHPVAAQQIAHGDRKSTRLNSSHRCIS